MARNESEDEEDTEEEEDADSTDDSSESSEGAEEGLEGEIEESSDFNNFSGFMSSRNSPAMEFSGQSQERVNLEQETSQEKIHKNKWLMRQGNMRKWVMRKFKPRQKQQELGEWKTLEPSN